MNNKQFLTELSGRCQLPAESAARQVQNLIGVMEELWKNGDAVTGTVTVTRRSAME